MTVSGKGKQKYGETKRLIQQAMYEKQLVLFIGAGASVDSGMPLWRDAVSTIANRLGIEDETDSLKIPQYYFSARGNKEYTQLMHEIFHFHNKLETKPVHKRIIAFHADTIITTNYDHLLEQAAEENGEFLQVVSCDADLPYRKAGKELIKMHGDFEHGNFVLKEDDYLHYHTHFKLIENYIKSLIGSKVILFIGYSLNDPNMKQICVWVKEILDDGIQRAYLIETGHDFNENENDYFKHLGVNLIYSRELLGENLGHSQNLLTTLDYLLKNGAEESAPLEQLYSELSPFARLNYTYRKYIDQAFMHIKQPNASIYIDNNSMLQTSENADDKKEEMKRVLGCLTQAMRGEYGAEKAKTICAVLDKNAVRGIRALDDKEPTYFAKLEVSDLQQAMFEFDYGKLGKMKAENASRLVEADPESYMRQGAVCWFLHDYASAYACMDNAARAYYRRKEFEWYFIAVYNKRNIGEIIAKVPFLTIDKSVKRQITEEMDAIDLNRTLQSLPNLGNNQNTFLKDLISFKFSSDLFMDTYQTSERIRKESRQTYVFYSGIPAYESMRLMITDYHRYCAENYILVDRYRENNAIYNFYVTNLFASLTAPDKENASGFLPGHISQNIHAKAIEREDIHYILRYMDSSVLYELLSEYNVGVVSVTEEAKAYIDRLAETLPTILDCESMETQNVLYNYCLLMAHIQLDEELAVKILKTINGISDERVLWYGRDAVAQFTTAVYKQALYQYNSICMLEKKLITKLLSFFSDENNYAQHYWTIIVALLNCCNAGEKPYSDIAAINKLLQQGLEKLVINMYPACSPGVQTAVKKKFSKWKNAENYQLYGNLVLLDVIPADAKLEKIALNKMRDDLTCEKKNGVVLFRYDDALPLFLNLHITGKLFDRASFEKLAQDSQDDFVKWLIDINAFDNARFDIAWLSRCRDQLLKDIASNAVASAGIKRAFFKVYNEKPIDKAIMDIMIQCFLNDAAIQNPVADK